MKDSKGFTLVELLGVIVVLGIVSGLAVVSINHLVKKGQDGVYQNYEATLKGSSDEYLIENPEKMPSIGGNINISYLTLKNAGLISELKDPRGGNCNSSYVIITRGNDVSNKYNLTYKVCLICGSYKSSDC